MTPETEALIAEAREFAVLVYTPVVETFTAHLVARLVAALEAAEQEKEYLDAQCGINWEAKAYAEAALQEAEREKGENYEVFLEVVAAREPSPWPAGTVAPDDNETGL